MSVYINLWNEKSHKKIFKTLKKMGLENTFSNRRTSIWENDKAHISVDKKVTRILLYDFNNMDIVEKMKSDLC